MQYSTLDTGFAPMEIVLRQYENDVKNADHQRILLAVERNKGRAL